MVSPNPIVRITVSCDVEGLSILAHTHRACPRTIKYVRKEGLSESISVPINAKIMIRHLTRVEGDGPIVYRPCPTSSLDPWFSIVWL